MKFKKICLFFIITGLFIIALKKRIHEHHSIPIGICQCTTYQHDRVCSIEEKIYRKI